jgi:glucosamine-6-phosphate deaminase
MNIITLPFHKIAPYVADSLSNQVKEKPNSILGMTTGTTPITTGIFREWVVRVQRHELDLSQCRFVNPDEFVGISLDHPESYHTYMMKHLFRDANIPLNHTLCHDGNEQDLKTQCEQFDHTVQNWGGIDWQLMGLGRNGHICFIEPNQAIPATSYIVDIAEENRRLYAADFGSTDAVPKKALTTGLRMVMSARQIVLVAVGEQKADIVSKTVLDPISTHLPATFLQLHQNTTLILDEGAARNLPSSLYTRLN